MAIRWILEVPEGATEASVFWLLTQLREAIAKKDSVVAIPAGYHLRLIDEQDAERAETVEVAAPGRRGIELGGVQ